MKLLEGMIEGPHVDGRILPRLANGEPPQFLYRIMSIDEYEQGVEQGYFTSREGRIHADIEPHFQYAEPGDDNVLVRIAYRDDDGWRTKWTSMGCIAITDGVPADRVTEVSRGSRASLELRESAPAVNGFWVTDAGELLYNDWEKEIHHSAIAARHFGTDDKAGFTKAMSAGWIRVIVLPGMELNAQWNVSNRKALRALRAFVAQSGTEFPNYFIEGMAEPEDPEVGIDKRTFLQILDDHINRTINESVEEIEAWSGARLRVHHNPPREAFRKIVAKCDVLRGILSDDGQNVWLWNGHQAIHSNVSQELGIPASWPCIFYNRGRWDGPVWGDGELAPALARLTPEIVAAKKERDRRESDELMAQLMDDDQFGLLAETLLNENGLQFFWKIPPEAREVVRSWKVWSKSPYSHSYYDVESGQKTWTHTPLGSHRVSDHWNFVSHGERHCPTDVPVENGRMWALGRWDGEKYVILKQWPRVKLSDVPDTEARTLSPAQRKKREKIIQQLSNRPDLRARLNETASIHSIIDVANYFLETRDDLLDDDEECDRLVPGDEKVAEEIIRREYVSGTCGAYAIALHDKTGHPIVGINGGMHVAVQAPDGDIIDYMGKNSLQAVMQRYGMTDAPVQPWSREQAVEHVLMGDEEGDPWDDISIAKWVLDHRGMLTESQSWFHTMRYGDGTHDIFKNPSRQEVLKMIAADTYKSVRAICTPEDVYVFTADMSHGEVQAELGWGLWDNARIFIDATGPYINECDDMAAVGTDDDYEDEKDRAHNAAQLKMVVDWCTDHPVLRRWFPGYRLGFR